MGNRKKTVAYGISETAQRVVRFRYVCSKCGQQTDWYKGRASVTRRQEQHGGVNAFSRDDTARLRREAEQALAEELDAQKSCVEQGIYTYTTPATGKRPLPITLFDAASRCPNCKAPQPWHRPRFYKPGYYALALAVVGLALGVGVLYLFSLPRTPLAVGLALGIPLLMGFASGLYLGTVLLGRQRAKYNAARALTAQLEVVW